jgi:hypothetical protein
MRLMIWGGGGSEKVDPVAQLSAAPDDGCSNDVNFYDSMRHSILEGCLRHSSCPENLKS